MLTKYRKAFLLSLQQFINENKIHSSEVEEKVKYEKITDVTRIDTACASCFFKDGALKMIYISDEAEATRLWNEFQEAFNPTLTGKVLRSRAGKTANQHVFASEGFTVSLTKDEVHFIEMYPPCSIEEYMENIYREPGLFIR